MDAVLDHRARRVQRFPLRWGLQTAPFSCSQIPIWREDLCCGGELPFTRHVPGQEGRLYRNRSSRVSQHDCGEVRLHGGQHLYHLR